MSKNVDTLLAKIAFRDNLQGKKLTGDVILIFAMHASEATSGRVAISVCLGSLDY